MGTVLVLGASGSLGQVICDKFANEGWVVQRASRGDGINMHCVEDPRWTDKFLESSLDAVVWASGANVNDSVGSTDESTLISLLDANVLFLHRTVDAMLRSNILNAPCRFVVLSSVWQSAARSGKYSYMVAKSALAGLVRSWAIDLAPKGIAVNSVLPGVTDTPMTRRNLTASEVHRVIHETPQGRLVTPIEVANAVIWLSSPLSTGVNGESIVVDGGWMRTKHV